MIVPVILCGGAGVRLWPASTPDHPKQFIALIGERSLFQQAVMRVSAIAGASAPLIVVGVDLLTIARAQLDEIGVSATLLAEPQGRDSGPALLAAAMWIARKDPSAIVVAVASDHDIPDLDAFCACAATAAVAAGGGDIVTFGVRPDRPAGQYGYIEPGEAIGGTGGLRRIVRFIEKPDAERAARLITAGALWNSGNFVFRVDAFLAEAMAHAPAMVSTVAKAVDTASVNAGEAALGACFSLAEKSSIDVALMEKTARAAVLPIDYAWSDLGSWRAVWAASPRDADGNAITGAGAAWKSRDCLVRADAGIRIVAVGLKNVGIIVVGGMVLVCDLDAGGEMKQALEAAAGSGAALDEANSICPREPPQP
ncbi:MAG TPA: sugar phosphate nucleotidyltransferase [Caulobacteraceae bacterium]